MIPIFIITCDRLECLKKSIQSYRNYIKTPFEIVIVDFGTTYPLTIEYLKQLELQGTKVYWKGKIQQPLELKNASNCIKDYFETHPVSNYVVTDPDVELDLVKGDILDVYSYLLDEYQSINVVGPMLRIDDIPNYYPYKNHIITGKMGQHKKFHSLPINKIIYNNVEIKFVFAPIDTTFGMYPADIPWNNLNHGIRVLSPYSARHLDWYVDFKNPTPDQAYYMEHASKYITHWSHKGE